MSLHAWAVRWGIPPAAVQDLQQRLGLDTPVLPMESPAYGKSEAWVQSMARLEASRRGIRVFRNNVGALKTEDGRQVRFGLGNDSPGVNAVIKSSDLIGWHRHTVTDADVGTFIAQFWCREIKAPGWQYKGAEREVAQRAWIDMVNADGGDAAFLTDPERV